MESPAKQPPPRPSVLAGSRASKRGRANVGALNALRASIELNERLRQDRRAAKRSQQALRPEPGPDARSPGTSEDSSGSSPSDDDGPPRAPAGRKKQGKPTQLSKALKSSGRGDEINDQLRRNYAKINKMTSRGKQHSEHGKNASKGVHMK